jgi:hypothetical protein
MTHSGTIPIYMWCDPIAQQLADLAEFYQHNEKMSGLRHVRKVEVFRALFQWSVWFVSFFAGVVALAIASRFEPPGYAVLWGIGACVIVLIVLSALKLAISNICMFCCDLCGHCADTCCCACWGNVFGKIPSLPAQDSDGDVEDDDFLRGNSLLIAIGLMGACSYRRNFFNSHYIRQKHTKLHDESDLDDENGKELNDVLDKPKEKPKDNPGEIGESIKQGN